MILIVDDTVENLKLLSELLKQRYQIRVATNGQDALQLAQGITKPDLILLDIMMPELDGYTVCKQLKSQISTHDIPIIFLTAKNQPEDEVYGFSIGAADYITKPINPPILWARVKAQLALAHQLRKADQRANAALDAARHSEQHCQYLSDYQHALLKITRMALSDQPIEHYLKELLTILVAMPLLELESRGILFMLNRHHNLIMVAQQGLTSRQQQICAQVPLGDCICGKAAQSCEPAFLSSLQATAGRRLHDVLNYGCHTLPLTVDDHIYGLLILFTREHHESADHERHFMIEVAQIFTSLVCRRLVEERLRIERLEVQAARNEIIRKLSIAAEFRDTDTGLHVQRMSQYSRAIASVLGRSDVECELLELAAPMHDVGKIGIDDYILKKPGKLTPDEFQIMKTHTLIGGRILDGDDPLLHLAREIALTHHERWDGQGYPEGLQGTAISWAGRVCSVADVFDALTMRRPYKEPWPLDNAINFIEQGSGQAFDPAVVSAFKTALPQLLAIKARYHDEVINPHEMIATSDMIAQPETDCLIVWQPSYSVEIAIIDEHHRYLLYWLNRLHQAIHNQINTVEVAKTLLALEHYTAVHFRAEERLIHNYAPEMLAKHQLQHHAFEDTLHNWRQDISHNPFIAGTTMLDYLRTWLFNHILAVDKPILKTIKTTTPIPTSTEH
jgi:hemerythrin-like metal-binding protein